MGEKPNVAQCIGEAVFTGMLITIGVAIGRGVVGKNLIAASFAGCAAFGIGLCLSGRWVARQVPNAELRKHLANPDA